MGRYRRWVFFLGWAIISLAIGGATHAAIGVGPTLAVYEQRSTYQSALDDLTAGRTTQFKRAKIALRDYALFPYLEYHELQSRLSSASAADVERFRETHSELPVTDIILSRWLKRLGQRREWARLIKHYQPSTSAELRCYYLRALYGTGKREEAFAQVGELWITSKSQPKSCDPLFDVWIANEHLTYNMAWQRLQLALDQNNRQLARYLLRFFEGNHKPWAQSLYNVHVNPDAIVRTSRYTTDTTNARRVIRHGLMRLATRSVAKADRAWTSYQKSHDFTPAEREELEGAIMLGKAKDGQFPSERPTNANAKVTEAMAKAAITHRNWSEAQYWIELLPADLQGGNRWQYWLARAISASFLNSERANLGYRALAGERDYYGFLAAERLGLDPRLNGSTQTFSPAEIQQLTSIPAAHRAAELYAVGDEINARR
jgi:soluble lytic murein transglycosylase